MQSLSCDENLLTSLDVSKNTALTWLYCGDNQLASLDVSKNTALMFLSCYENQLTSLDVSKNTALDDLRCGTNQLTSLDVSKNTELKWLWCEHNQLTTLDVSECTALACLHCHQNQINGSGMDILVQSLPSKSDGAHGEFYVILEGDEGNEMTTTQAYAAYLKGWLPRYSEDGEYWQAYWGSNPSGIEEIKDSTIEELKYFDLQGHRIEHPTKGIYIVNGKKVMIK